MKLLVSAHEHSANIHLKSLLKYLPSDTQLLGIFDDSLGDPIADLRSSAIMGFVDAFRKYIYYTRLAEQMVTLVKECDKVLLIDSSGFNLPLAKKIKKAYPDKEIIYYILPQAWVWKKGRIKTLEQTVDKLASILPFEKNLYSKDTNIEYVGHPLLDSIKKFKTNLSSQISSIAFMPGSRQSEIRKLMPIFKEVAHRQECKSIIVIPAHLSPDEIDELYGDLSGFECRRDAHAVLLEVDFAFICSGTATLEASLIGTPFALCYIAKQIDYIIAKSIINPEHIGLGNILLKKYNNTLLHPELIQSEVTAENLINTMLNMDRVEFYNNSMNLLEYLERGSAKNIAQIITNKKYDKIS